MGFLIALIIIIPIVLRRQSWMEAAHSKVKTGPEGGTSQTVACSPISSGWLFCDPFAERG